MALLCDRGGGGRGSGETGGGGGWRCGGGGRCDGGGGRCGGGGGGTSTSGQDKGLKRKRPDEVRQTSGGKNMKADASKKFESNASKKDGKNIQDNGGKNRRDKFGATTSGGGSGKGRDGHTVEEIYCSGETPGGRSGASARSAVFTDKKTVLRGFTETSPSILFNVKSERRKSSDHVRKELRFCEEEQVVNIHMKLHQLILCEADMSNKFNVHQFLKGRRKVVPYKPTPGSHKHVSITTGPDVKDLVREMYILLKCVHKAGYCLDGIYTIDHFVLDRSKLSINARFGYLHIDVFKDWYPDGEKLDIRCFKAIVRRDIMNGETIPHELNLWLSMLGEKDIEAIIPNHVSLMDIQKAGDSFSSLYDTFANLENTQPRLYKRIIEKLSKYNGWQQHIKGKGCNDLLERTFLHAGPNCKPYDDTVVDLLRLLRNNRQHDSRSYQKYFALIVGQHFPNLISDLQIELFKAGCITA